MVVKVINVKNLHIMPMEKIVEDYARKVKEAASVSELEDLEKEVRKVYGQAKQANSEYEDKLKELLMEIAWRKDGYKKCSPWRSP